MKKIFGFTVFIAVAMLLLPLSALTGGEIKPTAAIVNNNEDKTLNITEPESFKIKTGDVITELNPADYIFGVVAAEMPALYNEEALKAQAVAAYTFACVRKSENSGKDYDITDDFNKDQSFITETAAREKWGEKADEYAAKIKNAVNAVLGEVITYNGEPITAVYHAVSSGITEDAQNVWGGERPYLKAVSSDGDKLAKNYISEAEFTIEELTESLKGEVEIKGEASDILGEIIRTESYTVKSVKICGTEISGFTIQNLLKLKSAAFDIKYQDGKFIFTVYGSGHGVGMSQNGANFMANEGSSYKEILKHYYSGCEIEKL